MELSVVIPTRDRLAILRQTLAGLTEQSGDVRFQVVVVDDGSRDGTPEWIRALAASGALAVELIEQPTRGPAAGRNRALAAARAPVCLFLNDDSWPRPDLLVRHRDFHRRHPEPQAALLGGIVLPSNPPPTPFMRWLAELQFDFKGIERGESVGGAHFFTANVSAKTELLQAAGGFDDGFAFAAHEDIDMGLRLQAQGMRLAYDPDAVVEHCHPTDLQTAIHRMRAVGRALAPFVERHPGWPVPRRPGARHRVKAAALMACMAAGIRVPALQREAWRFLCHQAGREGYWTAVDGQVPDAGGDGTGVRVGSRLARLAGRDEDARLPPGYPPARPPARPAAARPT